MPTDNTGLEVPIPVAGILEALTAGAVPGFYGTIEVRLSIKPEAAEDVVLIISREATIKAQQYQGGVKGAKLPADPDREKLVSAAVEGLKEKCRLRLGAIAIKGNFADGRLLDYKLQDVP